MAAGFVLPSNVRGIIADCGFTSPYDIFRHVANTQFRLPILPSDEPDGTGGEAEELVFDYKAVSTLDVLQPVKFLLLFIHGGKDDFVPTQMTLDGIILPVLTPKELLMNCLKRDMAPQIWWNRNVTGNQRLPL